MQFRLRTLLIVLAVGPVVLAGAWFGVIVPIMDVIDVARRSEQPPAKVQPPSPRP